MSIKKKHGEWGIAFNADSKAGKIVAFEIARMGYNVVLIGENKELLEQLAVDITRVFLKKSTIHLFNAHNVPAYNELLSTIGDLDVGIAIFCNELKISNNNTLPEPIFNAQIFDCSLMASFNLFRYYVRDFKIKNRGEIIVLSSSDKMVWQGSTAELLAQKAFIKTLCEAQMDELKNTNVRISFMDLDIQKEIDSYFFPEELIKQAIEYIQ